MRIEGQKKGMEAYWLCVQPGDGTRYSLHIIEDRYGGWLVIWKEAREMFCVSSRLDEIKSIVSDGFYNEKKILEILNDVLWLEDC